MTTEIVIMNKSAVALAADSAVTVGISSSTGNNCKIYYTANKLFALSKYAPVSLMIFGNASMMGIPWETIVKMYRDKLNNRSHPYLADYCTDFLHFLEEFPINEDITKEYVRFVARVFFTSLKNNLDKWVDSTIKETGQCPEKAIVREAGALAKAENMQLEDISNQSPFTIEEHANICIKYKETIQEQIKKIFGSLPLTRKTIATLIEIAINAASIGRTNQSGVVIAGFGANEIYPSYCSFDITAVFENKIIKRDLKKGAITHDTGAMIIPFAQSKDVATFMEGIGPSLSHFLKGTFYEIMTNSLPERLCQEVGTRLSVNPQTQEEIRRIANEMCKGACDFAFHKLEEKKWEDYISPVIKATGFFNKSELATMAEALVNLESFRKQVTMEAETVGGPIDVAVITKGDGLVWIKRKQYFPPELNHHFFNNYFKGTDNNGEEAQN